MVLPGRFYCPAKKIFASGARSFRIELVWVDLAETSGFCSVLDNILLSVGAAVARRARHKIILRAPLSGEKDLAGLFTGQFVRILGILRNYIDAGGDI